MKGLAMLLHSWLKQAYPHLDWTDPAATLRTALPDGFDITAFLTQVQQMPLLMVAYAERQARIETMLQTLLEVANGSTERRSDSTADSHEPAQRCIGSGDGVTERAA